jgi:hypothetical protein
MCSEVVFGSSSLAVWGASVLEVFRSCGKSAWHDNGCLDPPAGQLASVANGQRIHPDLSGTIGSEIRWSFSALTTARDPDNQSLSLCAEMRKGRAVYVLGAEHISVIELGQLIRCEGFSGSKDHMACVVNDHVYATVFTDDSL